jgi:hypothetical protein
MAFVAVLPSPSQDYVETYWDDHGKARLSYYDFYWKKHRNVISMYADLSKLNPIGWLETVKFPTLKGEQYFEYGIQFDDERDIHPQMLVQGQKTYKVYITYDEDLYNFMVQHGEDFPSIEEVWGKPPDAMIKQVAKHNQRIVDAHTRKYSTHDDDIASLFGSSKAKYKRKKAAKCKFPAPKRKKTTRKKTAAKKKKRVTKRKK